MTRHAAIYARFSCDRQNERSIDDQVAAVRELCAREGLIVTAVYTDAAISAASVVNRPGFQAMMRAAEARAFEVIATEDIDRLSRDQGDYHTARRRLDFLGIAIVALSGTVSRLDGSLRALMGEMYLENLATHTRRGLEAVIRDGRHAGGRAYGYRPVPSKPGELAIEEAEATIVREIFADYVAGKTPRQIVAALNARGIAPPRGRRWNASTINGDKKRGSGIILNELYAGRIVWNKVRMLKDPASGKRVSRPNAPDKHRRVAAEHLRIIDDATWQSARSAKQVRGYNGSPHTARKPKRFLSGLIKCGSCGGGMASLGADHGRVRLQCSTHRESGSCGNSRKVYRDTIETMVLDALRANLDDPALIAEYAGEYNRERARLARAEDGRSAHLELRAGEIARDLDRIIDAIIKTGAAAETFAARVKQLEAERDSVAGARAAIEARPKAIALHPASLARYRADVERLAVLLDQGRDGEADDLIAAIRALVAAVVITAPKAGSPEKLRIEVRGRLAELTDATAFPSMCRGETLVAGGCSGQSSPGNEPQFRIASTA